MLEIFNIAQNVFFNVVISIFEYICVFLVIFYILLQKKVFQPGKVRQTNGTILMIIFFGILSIYGSTSGISNLREFAPIIGGILGGPLIGVGSAFIGAVHVLLVGGQTSVAGAAALLVAGTAGGLAHRYSKGEFLSPTQAFVFCLLLESFNVLLVILFSKYIFHDFATVYPAFKKIMVFIIFENTLGLTLFASMVRNINKFEDLNATKEKMKSELSLLCNIQENLTQLETAKAGTPGASSYDWLQAHMQLEKYGKDAVIFKKDEVADKIYLVKRGKLLIRELEKTIDEGKVFGEMGVFSPLHKRTASVVCLTECEIYSLPQQKLLNVLSESPSFLINMIQLSIGRSMTNLADTISEKEKIESELKIASEIQISMLPRQFPAFPGRSELDVYAVMFPAKEVGGDLYDFFAIDADRYGFIIGDVSGKGVPAALYMAITKTLLKSEALKGRDPAAVLEHVHNIIYPDNKELMFITVFCSILDIRTGELTFSNAGHNPPLLSRSGGDFEYIEMKPNVVLGVMDTVAYVNEKITLGPNDAFFMYTDGVNEAMNTRHEQYDYSRLKAALSKIRGNRPKELIESIKAELDGFSAGTEQSDDITILAFSFLGKKPG